MKNKCSFFAFLAFLLVLAACKKSDDFPGAGSKVFQDSIDLSGIYSGNLYRNTQVVIAIPPTNIWDTTNGLQINFTLVDSTHLLLYALTSPSPAFNDTIDRQPLAGSTIPGADMYFYEYKPAANMVYYVYYFRTQDSIYMHAFPPPGGGHSTHYYYYGKK